MPWRLDVSPRARRDLAGMRSPDREAMASALERVAEDPGGADFKKLSGAAGWRLRVGQWRALVDLDTQTGLMTVSRFLNRRDAYR